MSDDSPRIVEPPRPTTTAHHRVATLAAAYALVRPAQVQPNYWAASIVGQEPTIDVYIRTLEEK